MRRVRFIRSIRISVSGVLVGLILTSHTSPSYAQDAIDLILRGGKVVTMDDEQPQAEALAVRGDRIVAVGSNDEISRRATASTRIIELEGQLVLPGFIEGHGHFLSLGHSKGILDNTRAETWEDIVKQVGEAAGRTPAGQWIVGRGWHQGKWNETPADNVEGYPVHSALSRATPNHPVMLTHRAGHMLLANAKALQLAGLDEMTQSPAGGDVLRNSSGQLTGVFRENAMSLVHQAYQRSLSRRSSAELDRDFFESIRLATEECLRHGVTSFQDAGSSFADVDAFLALAERQELKVRLWLMLDEDNDALAHNLAEYRMIGAANHHVSVRGIKRLVDGALGTHGAWLMEPYDDLPGSTGHNTTSLGYLRRTAELALENDYQLCVHAIGDRANHEVLNLFERSFAGRPPTLRWRIEHAQHLHPADIPRFHQLGVIASMQGIHCTSDAPFVVTRLGQRRAAAGAYAWRALLDAQAVVINGTDTPVENLNPIECFYASVTRRLPNGLRFFPEQCMSREEALRSYTRDAALAAFEEDLKGTLTPGKLADIVVLSHDILTIPEDDIRETKVVHTIVGGKVLYSRENAR